MVNKWLIPLGCISLLLPTFSWSEPPIESATVADLSALQQQILLLKVSIKRLKLQQELQQLMPLTEATTDFCQSSAEGLSPLRLTALYTVAGQRFASLAYHRHASLEASRGDRLLCGETLLEITTHGVEIEKRGRRYQLTGASLPPPPRPSQAAAAHTAN